jgi:hypothetical protein
MRFRIFYVVVLVFSFGQLRAQDNFSESFFNIHKNSHLHVPSNACAENDLEGNVAYRTYVGKLSVIRSYYADLNINLRKKEFSKPEHYKHVLGLGFYNDKEGDFFTKARVLTRYAIHLPLREDLFLSLGASFHLINYSFNASGAGASGSDWEWSGGMGTTLYSPTFKLGIALNEFNNPNIRPISYDFIINRYFTFYGEKLLSISEGMEIKGAGRCNWVMEKSAFYIMQLGFVFSKTVGINGLHYVNKGTGMAFDLSNIKLHKGFFDFSLAYLVPSENATPSAAQYELNLRFYVDR